MSHFSLFAPLSGSEEAEWEQDTADKSWFRCTECGGERWLPSEVIATCSMPECRDAEMERL